MRATYYIALSVALLCLMGCGGLVQEVDPGNVPTTTAKLVVHSYISPQDTVLAVLVEAPRAILGQQADYNRVSISNALVDLSDGTTTIRLPYNVKNSLYRIDPKQLPIIAGRTYVLTVTAPNYPAVTAQCTVPMPVLPSEIWIDSTYQDFFEQRQLVTVSKLVWQDPGGQANYYRVTGLFSRTIRTQYATSPTRPARDTTIVQSGSLRFDVTAALASDQGKDGQRFVSPAAYPVSYGYGQQEQVLALQYSMTLLNVDVNYYRYHDAAQRQAETGENPFAEPVLIPSNVQNGLGCFGAFNQSSITVRIR
ncbi:DUF4249 domain-containing protein [Fibrella sp. USSR17]